MTNDPYVLGGAWLELRIDVDSTGDGLVAAVRVDGVRRRAPRPGSCSALRDGDTLSGPALAHS